MPARPNWRNTAKAVVIVDGNPGRVPKPSREASLPAKPADSARGSGIAATCTDVNEKLAFAKERQTQLSPFGVTAAFLAQLEANVRALEQASGTQNASIAQLPDSLRAFCEAKGRLYLSIKDIISAGHALHAGNLEAAAKYNAKRLYAKSGKGKAEGAGETGTTGTTEKK